MNVKKILIIVGIIVALGAIVGFTVNYSQKSLVAVQTGKVQRQDIASTVTAPGEIKPLTFANIGANALGRITKLYVQEGDHVKKGQVLATLESIQPAADVAAMKAQLESSQTDAAALDAGLKTAMAVLNSSKADLERAKLDWDRAQGLFKDQLIAKADYDSKKSTYEIAAANVAQNQARVTQARAQLDSANGHITQSRAQLARASDILNKTVYSAPFDGVITSVPVREGETVVAGIQNSPGSVLMTISNLAVITAEVHVDETDIVNVAIGEAAEVTVDAIPGQVFKGKVTQIGDNAIIRSSGLSTSQSTSSSQEAKDFKVIITLDQPADKATADKMEKLRPGLSSTSKITTGTAHETLTIPLQALTMRTPADLEPKDNKKSKGTGTAAAAAPQAKKDKDKEQIQGVFVIVNKKAEFRKVETGLTGTTDIEIKSGLKDGDEIVTGSFKVLRTLRNGAAVKVDNSVVANKES